jgi:hypothetical protein
MANATVSRVGQINGANDTDALFLKLFGGMVVTYMQKESAVIPNGLVFRKTVSGQKSAQFPMTGLATASYHTPGAEIVGTAINHAEKVITIDPAYLIADSFLAEIDTKMAHWDNFAPYAQAHGSVLANILDQHLILEHILGARETSSLVTGAPAGYTSDRTIANDNLQIAVGEGAGADTVAIQAEAFFDNLVTVVTGWDNLGGCPSDGRFILVRPNLYNNLVRAVQSNGFGFSNSQYYGNSASIGTGKITGLMGVEIIKAKNIPSSNISASGNYTYHAADCRKTVAVAGIRGSVGLLDLTDVIVTNTWDARRLGWLLVSRYAKGCDWLRSEYLWELTTDTLTQVVTV